MSETHDPAVPIGIAGYKGLVDPRLAKPESMAEFLRSLDGLIRDGEAFKDDATSSVCRAQWNGCDIVVKRFNNKGIWHSLRHTLKGSRARHNWGNAHRLGRLNIVTPEPLAYVEEYRGLLLWRSYFVMRFTPGRLVSEIFSDQAVTEAQKHRIHELSLTLLDTMAGKSISHGDMKHTNLLYDDNGIVLMDLDALRIGGVGWLQRRRSHRDRQRYQRDLVV